MTALLIITYTGVVLALFTAFIIPIGFILAIIYNAIQDHKCTRPALKKNSNSAKTTKPTSL